MRAGESSEGGNVLVRGSRPHVCHPGWESRWCDGLQKPGHEPPPPAGWYLHNLNLAAGSVVQCECGQVWVAVAMKPWEEPGLVMDRIHWRKERWLERRRRERQSGGAP